MYASVCQLLGKPECFAVRWGNDRDEETEGREYGFSNPHDALKFGVTECQKARRSGVTCQVMGEIEDDCLACIDGYEGWKS
jgi:hypothetical protein